MHAPTQRLHVFRFGFVCFAIAFVAQVITHRYLLADGVNFFMEILTTQWFHQWDIPRHYHHLLTQWPMVAALAVGLREVSTLSWIYGASLFAAPWLTCWLCAWMLPEPQRHYLALPMIAMAHGSLHGALFIVSESHYAAGIYWILLFFLWFLPYQQPHGLQLLCVALLALSILRMYEFYLILGPLLSILAGYRLGQSLPQLHKPHQATSALSPHRTLPTTPALFAVLLLLMVCGLGGAIISFYYMFFSQRSVAQAGLGHIVSDLLQDPNCWLSGLLLLWFTWHWIRPKQEPQAMVLWSWAGVGLLLSGLIFLGPPFWIKPEWHYSGRLFNLLIPLGLTALLIYSWPGSLERLQRTSWLVPLLIMLVWNGSWQTLVSLRWQRYTQVLQQTLQTCTGWVESESIPFPDDHFGFAWSMPAMSIVYSAFAHQPVCTMLVPPPGPFEPFAPRDPASWPDLSAYGIVYQIPQADGQP